jgi:hypothetical protein
MSAYLLTNLSWSYLGRLVDGSNIYICVSEHKSTPIPDYPPRTNRRVNERTVAPVAKAFPLG